MIFESNKFVEVDLLLRRGGHVNRSSLVAYAWVKDNFDELKAFYTRYGCSLSQHPDGFYCLTLLNGLIRSRLLPKTCIHLGMFIALKARDPEITRSSGWLQIPQLLQDIETSVPKETLQSVYAPGRKESVVDERISMEIYGYAYVVLDITTRQDKRLIAGIFVEINDGAAVFKRWVIRNAPEDMPLHDILSITEGEHEYHPEFPELKRHLATRSIDIAVCERVGDYGQALYEAGILPSGMSMGTDRTLYAKLIETTFKGGLSRDVTLNSSNICCRRITGYRISCEAWRSARTKSSKRGAPSKIPTRNWIY